jgi:uncharacterized membrane protein
MSLQPNENLAFAPFSTPLLVEKWWKSGGKIGGSFPAFFVTHSA